MNTNRIVSVIPDGECAPLFKRATISVVQIGEEWIPDYNPNPLDSALAFLQARMFKKQKQSLRQLRSWLDWPPPKRPFQQFGVRFRKGSPSDLVVAAILLHPLSPFGIQYEWASGDVPAWPDGLTLVLWRAELFQRSGDTLTRWSGGL